MDQELTYRMDNLTNAILILCDAIESQTNISEWLPLEKCQEFFNYGSTQMASLIKSEHLVVSQVGRRKFISRQSLLAFLKSNIIH